MTSSSLRLGLVSAATLVVLMVVLQNTEVVDVRFLLWDFRMSRVVLMVLTAFFHGTGDTRTPLYVTIFANAINLVLDYGLIFGHFGLPAWGVAGAGTATSVAAWSASAVLFTLFRRRSVSERFDTIVLPPRTIATSSTASKFRWRSSIKSS